MSRPALRVHQWLSSWDASDFDAAESRAKPRPHFYLLSVPAVDLRRLSGVHRRSARQGLPRQSDLGVQRKHQQPRSDEIAEFIRRGFPWSTLSAAKRDSGEYDDLIKPGWLPTGIVVNILRSGDTRNGRAVHAKDLLRLNDAADKTTAEVHYPDSYNRTDWVIHDAGTPPIEIIDGQHRLLAFDEDPETDDDIGTYELPVVAFHGLDIGWQAYLFYTINIKPKRINMSLGYDLYPLLRTAEWLENTDDHFVYRDTRAQELVEIVWSFESSPWYDRIDMLGDRSGKTVTQSAWIRSLTTTLVRSFKGRGTSIGGLFGASRVPGVSGLSWSRSQQAAFLIFAWQQIEAAVSASTEDWALDLRGHADNDVQDPAFYGPYSLLNSDQGINGVHRALNDMCYVMIERLGFDSWMIQMPDDDATGAVIEDCLEDLPSLPAGRFVAALASYLAKWDWRSSRSPGLDEPVRQSKARFRGTGGYREIRNELIAVLAEAPGDVGEAAVQLAALQDDR